MYVYLNDSRAQELIPDIDPAFPDIPIEERYTPDFVEKCVHVPDDTAVPYGWMYDEETGTFHEPKPAPPPESQYTADNLFAALLGIENNSSRGSDLEPALCTKADERHG